MTIKLRLVPRPAIVARVIPRLTGVDIPVGASHGGTGISSYTIGDVIYASAATTLSKLADVATGNALISGGVATAPEWGKIGLTTHVSGILPIANGGSGTATGISAAAQGALDDKVAKSGDTMSGALTVESTVTTEGTVTINPPTGGFDQALNIDQTVAGTLAHPDVFYGSNFQYNDHANAQAHAFNFNMSLNDAAWRGFKTTMSVNAFVNVAPTTAQSTVNDYNVVAFAPAVQGGIAVNAARDVSLFALNPIVNLTEDATGYSVIVGAEFDIGAQTDSTVDGRIGIQVISTGPVNGSSNLDYAFLIGTNSACAEWDFGLGWYNNAFKSTSTIIGTANTTAASRGVDFRGVTFSNDAFASSGFSVSSAGALAALSVVSTNPVTATGYAARTGMSGSYSGNSFNIDFVGSVAHLWVDTSNLGAIAFTSDYRIKKDVVGLPTMWDTVKALRPIKYTQAQFSPPSHVRYLAEAALRARREVDEEGPEAKPVEAAPLFAADDIERWGFIAHELQETLVPSAATGVKDQEDLIQSPNPFTLIAALTKALQETMARVEKLEAATPP